jgi:hypothetical protein
MEQESGKADPRDQPVGCACRIHRREFQVHSTAIHEHHRFHLRGMSGRLKHREHAAPVVSQQTEFPQAEILAQSFQVAGQFVQVQGGGSVLAELRMMTR